MTFVGACHWSVGQDHYSRVPLQRHRGRSNPGIFHSHLGWTGNNGVIWCTLYVVSNAFSSSKLSPWSRSCLLAFIREKWMNVWMKHTKRSSNTIFKGIALALCWLEAVWEWKPFESRCVGADKFLILCVVWITVQVLGGWHCADIIRHAAVCIQHTLEPLCYLIVQYVLL